jgi:DNA recombination protein RmuC
MDSAFLIITFIIGLILGTTISYLFLKGKCIPPLKHEQLNRQLQEAVTNLKVSEEKLLSAGSEKFKLETKLESREMELGQSLSRATIAETNVFNLQSKNKEQKVYIEDLETLLSSRQETLTNLQSLLSEMKAENNTFKEKIISMENTCQQRLTDIQTSQEEIKKLTAEISVLTADGNVLKEKLATQKNEVQEIQKIAHLQFEKIANQILEEKSDKFTEVNKANIEALLKPLGENINTFKKKVEETYDKESRQRFSLEEKVKELVEQTNKVSNEANNLATALKGQSKKQGNWGEVILESILQHSGLVKDREYFLQHTIKDEEGKILRPDVLVKLPDNRVIIIDSKVSLVAYDRYSSAETVEKQNVHLDEHMKSVYGHINDLHNKKYDNLEESLDFTMMFMPIEPAYMLTIQTEQNIWAYAYSRRILLISPTNLIACLKLMADLWKREMQSKNALDIVKRGELLYEKFIAFVNTLEDVGRYINRTQASYNNAINQLNTGSGNLVSQAIKLKDLGLKSGKVIPPQLMPSGTDLKELPDTNSDVEY